MSLHFDQSEYESRLKQTLRAMSDDKLDGMLIFKQESMYWLTGYDTFGFCFFQCLILRADGKMGLLTRSADLRQAQLTSIIKDIRVWPDGVDANPAKDLREMIQEFGLLGKKLGIEWEAHGLTAANGRRIDAALGGSATLIDASLLISKLRLIKSTQELVYVQNAAQLADDALDAAIEHTRAGTNEGIILARMHDAVFEGGGDYPSNPFIIGSGAQALLCRYVSGRRTLKPIDQMTIEWGGVYRMYHACMMRTLLVGQSNDHQQRLFAGAKEALLACEDRLRPGNTMGHVFDAHALVLDKHGLGQHRLNACGYSLGAVYAPSWMDWPMFYKGNPVEIQANMVLFLHMIIMDSESGHAMCLGRTSIVCEKGAIPLSKAPLEIVVC